MRALTGMRCVHCRLLTAYVNVLPLGAVLRIWDCMLFERSAAVLFRVMLGLIDASTQQLLACCDAAQLWALLARLPGSCADTSAVIDGALLQFAAFTGCAPIIWCQQELLVVACMPGQHLASQCIKLALRRLPMAVPVEPVSPVFIPAKGSLNPATLL